MDCVQTMRQASVNKSKLNIAYTILVVLYPLLSMYHFFGTKLSIADACAILIILLMLLRYFGSFILNKLFLMISAFVIFHTCIVLLVNGSDSNYDAMDLIGTTLRLLLIWFLLSLAKNHFDLDIGKKLLIAVATISTIYLFVQYVLSFAGIYIGGGIPFLSDFAFRDDVAGYVDQVVKYGLNYRARSFFEEPIHYSLHIVLAIVLMLFDNKKSPKWPLIIFLSLGVICSMSLLGWIALFFVFLYWIKCSIAKGQLIKVLFFGVIAVMALLVLLNTSFVQTVIFDKFKQGSIFEDAHFEGYYNLFSIDRGLFELLFGGGLITDTTYTAGIPRMITSFGVIGAIVCFAIGVYYLKKSYDNKTRCILWLFILLNIGSEILFGKFILLYLAFCVFNEKRECK